MPALRNINKSSFLSAVSCPTRGWLKARYKDNSPRTDAENLRAEEGIDIGTRAQTLFKGGVLVSSVDPTAAANETKRLLPDETVSAICEATFVVDGYVARADVLERQGDGWHLIEVKSSLNLRDELVEDVAYTLMVLRRARIKVHRVSLMLLSRRYRLGQPNSKLFASIDCTEAANDQADQLELQWTAARTAVRATKQPPPQLIHDCRACEFFKDSCLGKDVDDHIFELPRFSKALFDKLVSTGVSTIHEIPDVFDLGENRERARTAVTTDEPVVNPTKLREFLSQVKWPAFYLDFETVKSAVPLYPRVAPQEQVVTQYSIHVCSQPGKVTAHREFLADAGTDNRRQLAERLLADLKGTGHVIVYSGFEAQTIGGLAKTFPVLRPKLKTVLGRLFDLERAFQWYWHRDFRGRTSIKSTLPALVKLSYDGLTVGNGEAAIAAFVRLARRQVTGKAARDLRAALLKYCKRDTLAMVKLHRFLCSVK